MPTPEVHYRAGSDDSGIKWLIAACVVIVVVVGISVLSSHGRSERPPRASVTVPDSREIKTCPIKEMHPGMLLQDVRQQLAGYAMDYRGLRQDENVYYVDAGVCHALLDFNDSDNGLDSIDYGEGFDKIEFRNRVQPRNTTDHSAPSPASTPTTEPTVDASSTGKDGCDDQVRSKVVTGALMSVFPPDPLDVPKVPLRRLDPAVLLVPDDGGEPQVVRDVNLTASDTPVCVYSDEALAVYVPSSLFTERMRALMMGTRRPHDTFLGLPMPQARFDALTYWSFKKARSEEFSWIENASRYRYEARQVTFDTDKKVFLFTSDTLADEKGFIVAKQMNPQRAELDSPKHVRAAKILERLGDLINREDLVAEMTLKHLRE